MILNTILNRCKESLMLEEIIKLTLLVPYKYSSIIIFRLRRRAVLIQTFRCKNISSKDI
jgi:hypothetical protein